jgi:hypothetical protein
MGSSQLLQRREDIGDSIEANGQDTRLGSGGQKGASGTWRRKDSGPTPALWEDAKDAAVSQRRFRMP